MQMNVGRMMMAAAGALLLVSGSPSRAVAQDHDHGAASPAMTAEQKKNLGELVKVVRDATERFQDVRVAEAEGYALNFGCVSGGDFGAMGLHYVNGALVGDGEI